VVVAFLVLPKDVLEIPKIGSINLHVSLLPRYRGAAPHPLCCNELHRQNNENASPAHKIFPDDCRIDFSENTSRVYNMIRGLGPFPGAWAVLDGQRFRIHEARPADYSSSDIRPTTKTMMTTHQATLSIPVRKMLPMMTPKDPTQAWTY